MIARIGLRVYLYTAVEKNFMFRIITQMLRHNIKA